MNHHLPPLALCSSLPRVRLHYTALLSLACLWACAGEADPNPVEEAFAASSNAMETGAAVAFRFPASGGLARLYRLPNMEEVTWRFELGPRHPVRMIGFVSDDDLIYALAERDGDEAFDLIALDLVAGRGRTIDTSVTAAAIGPTGTAYVFRLDGTVGQIEHRSTDIWPDTLENPALAIWGAARGRLLTILENDGSRELVLLARGQTPVRQPLPNGELAVEGWGGLVGVVVDSGVITLDPADTTATRFVAITARPRLITFSTSGHQIYVISGDQDLVVVDRFQNTVGGSLRLPGRITALRVGPLGRRLLVYSAEAGSIWVVDPIQLSVEATLPGSWEDDLPAIAPDGTILLRRGGSLVAFSGNNLEQAGVSTESNGDLWLVAQWDPHRPALELARDSTLAEGARSRMIYVQVSASHNAAFAQAMAEELSRAGMPTTVLAADSTDEFYRVVMGPYSTREEAEASARRLGRPFYIHEVEIPVP
jgi:hypothetical protein